MYSRTDPRKHRKAFLFPKTLSNMSIQNDVLTYNVGAQQRTINIRDYFDTDSATFSFRDVAVIKVISNFNDLYVGDLAFLAMTIGMNNSSGAHCIHCKRKAREFNCNQIQGHEIRTKASLTECLNQHNTNSLARKSVRNHLGVNTVGLLDIDPKQIVVPILHCPMGLVDKVLEAFKSWTMLEVELLPPESNDKREAYKSARQLHTEAVANETKARVLDELNNTPESAAVCSNAKVARANAKKEEARAKINCEEMTKRHNARIFSLSQDFDTIFRTNGVKKEHYHGGKCNGVNCILSLIHI